MWLEAGYDGSCRHCCAYELLKQQVSGSWHVEEWPVVTSFAIILASVNTVQGSFLVLLIHSTPWHAMHSGLSGAKRNESPHPVGLIKAICQVLQGRRVILIVTRR